MKKIYIVLFLFSLLACSDEYLEEKAPDTMTVENFFRDKKDAESVLASSYAQNSAYISEWWYEIKFAFEMLREELLIGGNDVNNYAYLGNVHKFIPKSTNWCIKNYWRYSYKGIAYANQLITKVAEMDASKIDENSRKELIAEAKFLRAYYHMSLLLNWDKIIIRDKMIESPSDLDKPLEAREDGWAFVVKDFEAAIPNMKEEFDNSNTGRATKFSAYAYLGHAYLTMAYEQNKAEYFDKAAASFKEIYQSGKFGLVDDFLSIFDGTNENSKESLFEYQLTANTSDGAAYYTYYHMFGDPAIGGWGLIDGDAANIKTKMTKEGTVNTKYPGFYDSRLYSTFYHNADYFNDTISYPGVLHYENGKSKYSKFTTVFKGKTDTYAFRKYTVKTNVGEPFPSTSGMNTPLMRYADVLLMYAEALVKKNSPDLTLATTCINLVRKRANMPNTTAKTKDELFEQVKHERMMELVGEGKNFYDLRRWGQAEAVFAPRGFVKGKAEFIPVPLDEINANPLVD